MLLGVLLLPGHLRASSICFLPWDDEVAARKIGFKTDGRIVEVTGLHPYKRTQPVAVTSGESPLQIVALDRKGDDGNPATIELKMNPNIKSPMVLLMPDPKSASGLRPLLIEDSLASFPWGTVRLLNATGKEFIIRHGKTVKLLPTNWTPVDIAPEDSARNVGVQVVERNNTKAILYSAVWEQDPDMRKLVIVIPGTDARSGLIGLKIVPEDNRALAAEEASNN
ncbi:MAG: hypothetical protein KDN05_05455 [Verrucomicrobiae bacterium]|nr:hypothetical protein [Verrucomicrobiae bacterium]